jgi:hypothetical protein
LSWGKVGPKQKRLVEAILNYPGHLIVTMRSKTEWVIGEGKDGKIAPEKIGLAPEQGKGIEYEFDLLLELKQNHFATATKDRTGKYQDEVIEKPGEDFGVALYEWLASGKPEKPIQKTPSKPEKVQQEKPLSEKVQTTLEKPKAEKPASRGKEPTLKERSSELIKEIGVIITSDKNGEPLFNEDEKEGARDVIKKTRLDEKGLKDLKEFRDFLSTERTKRESKKAA